MKVAKFISTGVMAGALLASGWLLRALWGEGASSSTDAREKVALAVAVTNAVSMPFNPPSEFVGHVEPLREVDVLPQIEGYLTAVKFREGALVKEGDLLFEIDSERYAAERRLRQAEIEKARGEVGVAQAEVDRAQRYVSRLTDADERGVTRSDIDNAEASLASARATLVAAQSGVVQAEANLALAEFNLKHTKIYAPFSGRMGKALRHEGDFVSPGKGELARLVRTDPVRVSFSIPDRQFVTWCERASKLEEEVRQLKRVGLVLPNGSEYVHRGEWDFMANEMDSQTATLQVRVTFPNPDGVLVANAYTTILVDDLCPAEVVSVPSSAVVRDASGALVWVLRETGYAEARRVSAGRVWKGMTEILDGLSAGEIVVFQGVQKVSADRPLRVVKPTQFD